MTGPTEGTGVSLVIPAYNEEARLARLVEVLTGEADAELRAAGLEFAEAVIVDDGSTDATSGLLHAAATEDERIRPLLGRRENRGKGAAIAAGVEAARAELVLFVDVDLSTPLSDAALLTEAMRRTGAEIAIGSRADPVARVAAPRHRQILGLGFNRAARLITGLDYGDTQCGFKLMRTELARRLLAEQITPGFAFDVELLMRARLGQIPVVEVPVSYVHDPRSKVRVVRDSVAMALTLVRLRLALSYAGRRARRKPLPPASGPT